MKVIILAAGRGKRMGEKTKSHPKCYTKIFGKSILDWQLDALQKAQLNDYNFVTGYKKEFFNHFPTFYNEKWSTTNMVYSLCCASSLLEKHTCIISYSDIIYHPNILTHLMQSNGDITITYDDLWKRLWSLRFKNPLDDAETFITKNNQLLEIGNKTNDYNNIEGQYMGLLKITPQGWKIIKNTIHSLKTYQYYSIDMTTLLQILLKNTVINTIKIKGKWCEIDSYSDLLIYENQLTIKKQWSHDWRYNKLVAN